MMGDYQKRLPIGTFIYLRGVPPTATDIEVAEYFAQYLPGITAADVSVRNYEHVSSAVISLPSVAAVALLRWVFSEAPLMPGAAKPIEFCRWKPKHAKESA